MLTTTPPTTPPNQSQRLQRKARRCRVAFRVGTLLLIFGSLTALLLLMAWQVGPGYRILALVCFALSLVSGAVGLLAGCWWYVTILHIVKNRDVHTIGYLLEAHATKEAVQPTIEQALIALLPQIQPTDTHLLTGRQRDYLYHLLKANHANLVFAVLDALKEMGDTRALPTVERLARGQWSAGYNLPVRQAAGACLEALRERAEYEQHSKGLLRASEAPTACPDVLLRPTTGTTVNPDELLRIANGRMNEPKEQ